MPGAQQTRAHSQGAAGLPLSAGAHRLLKEEHGHSSHEGLVHQEGVQDDPQRALQLDGHRGPHEGLQCPFVLHQLHLAEAIAVSVCSLLPTSLTPAPGQEWGAVLPGSTHLDPIHTSLYLLQLHADLAVPDVAECGEMKEGSGICPAPPNPSPGGSHPA